MVLQFLSQAERGDQEVPESHPTPISKGAPERWKADLPAMQAAEEAASVLGCLRVRLLLRLHTRLRETE